MQTIFDQEKMSGTALAFLSDLEKLCAAHGVQISVSHHDGMQLWPLREDEYCLHCDGLEDRIKK